MNYEELQKANDLLEKIKNVNDVLRAVKVYNNNIKISTNYRFTGVDFDYSVCFGGNHKSKILEAIKGIRDELVEELNKLGVVEEINNEF